MTDDTPINPDDASATPPPPHELAVATAAVDESPAALPAAQEHAALPGHHEGEGQAEAGVISAGDSTPEPEPASNEPVAVAVPDTVVAAPAPPESTKKWYVVKVQSGREESIKAAVERKVRIEGLEEFYGQIAIPVEEYVEKKKVRVTDKKTGEKVTQEKNVVKHRKKFPGYLFAEVEFNDSILYLFRETSGVGDFVGASLHRAPTPMEERDVAAMLTGVSDPKVKKDPRKVKVKFDYEKGDKVRIREGAFSGMEGEVKIITEPKDAGETPKVTVEVSIFGRPVPVELDYWQVDKS